MAADRKELKRSVGELFHGRSPRSIWFNRILLVANVAAVFLFLLDPETMGVSAVRGVEVGFGLLFLVEYFARFWIAGNRIRYVAGLMGIIDLVVIISLFAPILFGDFGFLRVVRALRILRAYRALQSIGARSKRKGWYARNEEVINSVVNLLVFIFIMTDIVYVMQVGSNPGIVTYVDALYFTLTTLTTTGFGDIIPTGQSGRLLTVLIMVIGVSLFIRLAQAVFRPSRVHFECPDCALSRHEPDAVHCRHCGRVIHIVDED